MDSKVANFARLYPWFSNMQDFFVVAHADLLSIFDVDIQTWSHIKLDSEIITGFRIDF